jgi:hypothetical protein
MVHRDQDRHIMWITVLETAIRGDSLQHAKCVVFGASKKYGLKCAQIVLRHHCVCFLWKL